MVQVLIGIIILAVILYGSVFIFQRFTTRKIRNVREQVNVLKQLPLGQDIEAGHQMSLTGQSLTAFNALVDEYQQVNEKTFDDLDHLIDQVLFDVRGINFVKTNRERHQAEALLTEASDHFDHVRSGLAELKKVDGEHRAAVARLEKKYQDLRKVLLSQNLSFEPSIDRLEQNLADLEAQFDEFTTLSQQGDHVAAQKVLDTLTSGTTALENLIETIPPLYADLKTGFNEQLMDISDGYQQMTADNYVFGNLDLPGQINRVRSEIQMATKQLTNLDLAAVSAANHNIEVQIDDLYSVLETEVTARPAAESQQNELHDFLTHAERQNHALQVELDRLSQSYVLSQGEIEEAQGLGGRLRQVTEQIRHEDNALTSHTDSYSNIVSRQREYLQILTDIEAQQRTINDGVKNLGQDEKNARKRFQQFDNQMHTLKRQIEALNLPGLPHDYLDYFYVVSDEVDKLGRDLSQTQINMEEISKQLIMIQADLGTLNEKSHDLRDSALLAEQLLQYANRYRNANEQMATASQRAQRLFDHDFKYADALEIMASALDTVEPGAYQRIENNYYGNSTTTDSTDK
ncbi:septation ring formation regulator EzrA [Furfurilactobacillus curtus]|uniref:Septation ring formation regulator EzrA n=1 Tax=Furfurilactobacillus curtus TaxID=1746200 RepID=A0ABQ5JN32_9LACO